MGGVGLRPVLAALLLALAGLLVAPAPAGANALLGGERAGQTDEAAPPSNAPSSALGARAPAAGGDGWMAALPGPVRDAVVWTARQQAAFNRALRDSIAAYRSEGALAPALALIGLSFLYGVFHAVGPGHGKAVVSTYFLARAASIRRGLALGALIAAIQAVSAIAIVGGVGLLLSGSRTAILGAMPLVEAVSYALVLLLGLAMTWAALTGRECAHDHGAGCGHDHGHPHAHGRASHAGEGRRWEFLAAAVVSGLRPCTGALIVLFFALGTGIFAIGVASAFAMAAGVALTVSAIGVAAILARRGLVRLSLLGADGAGAFGRAETALRALAVFGSLCVAGVGALLLMGAVSRGGAL
ncbi:MAG: high frequency lysogenization protein HflD [Alphaproteobacteria bacterium]|nr:high frequency lysogenization protein HflD [Alphaproteobacteria bacterium]